MVKHEINIVSESGYKLEEIDLLEIAAIYFFKQLGKLTKIKPIKCNVVITTDIKSDSSNENLNGDMREAIELDNGIEKNYYVCRLADYANSAETMRTLAHELVHVWQSACGKLVVNNDGWFWLGENYGTNPYENSENVLPWEVEAAKLDLQLVKKFYKLYFGE